MFKITSTAIAAALLLATPGLAFDDQDRAALETTFKTLTAGIASNDYDAVFSTISPAILAKMAEPTGMEPAAFRQLVVAQMQAAMEEVQIKDVSYDLDALTSGTTDAGRDYAVVMTTTSMVMGEQEIEAGAPALGFEDDGKWYVIQLQSPDQAAVLASVYPDLAAVELPEGEMTLVE